MRISATGVKWLTPLHVLHAGKLACGLRTAEARGAALPKRSSDLEICMARTSSSELLRNENEAAHPATFEQTWPRYEFAELVRLGLALGGWLVNVRRRLERRGSNVSSRPLPGEMNPAE